MKKKGLANEDSGFKVPEGYFESFEARMMDRISSNIKLPSVEQPFKVPENYFGDFEHRMLQKIGQEPRSGRVIPLYSKKMLSYVAGIAAVLAVIFTSDLVNPSEKTTFEDLDMVAVENYLFETLDLSNPEETPMIDQKEISFAQGADSNFDHEAVLEYLTENVEEPSILLNEE